MLDQLGGRPEKYVDGGVELVSYRPLPLDQQQDNVFNSEIIQFQNELWNAICSGDFRKAKRDLENDTKAIGSDFLADCLQAILYMSWLERNKEFKFLLHEPEHQNIPGYEAYINLKKQNGKTTMFWAVRKKSKEFKRDFTMNKLIILQKFQKIVKLLIYEILKDPELTEVTLKDGTPLLHIILLVGRKFDKVDEASDLLTKFLDNHRERVCHICPWSQLSALDIAFMLKQHFTAKQLYSAGVRANVFVMDEMDMFREDILQARLNSVRHFNASQQLIGCNNLNESLVKLRDSEDKFLEDVMREVIPQWEPNKSDMREAEITERIFRWINKDLEECQRKEPLSFSIELALSGSINECCKIRPLDEIDLVIECKIENDVCVTDKSTYSDWLFSTKDSLEVQRELAKVGGKNPFQSLCKVLLKENYPEFETTMGGEINPKQFAKVMNAFIFKAIQEEHIPEGLEKREGEPLLELTKSGLFMYLFWTDEAGNKQKLTLDIVSVLKLSRNTFRKILPMMPKYDADKYDYLCKNKLWSSRDGVLVKGDCWRLSFSNSEAKLIATNPTLFQVLKYLNKRSENHIDIETYFLKECFCSFLVHQGMRNEPPGVLSHDMAKLINFSFSNPISSPFYATKLGSRIEINVQKLFDKIEEYLPQAFQDVQTFQEIKTRRGRSVSESVLSQASYGTVMDDSWIRHSFKS